jgi:hypothetical protein
MYMFIYIYMYVRMYVCACMGVYIYIYSVELGYNNIVLYDASFIASNILWYQ